MAAGEGELSALNHPAVFELLDTGPARLALEERGLRAWVHSMAE